MLKAIVAKVVRAAAKAGRAVFAFPALPPSPRFAPAKVKAIVCKVALMAVLSPAVLIAADEARAQQDIMDDAACALEGKLPTNPESSRCSSECIPDYVRDGSNCVPVTDCATATVPANGGTTIAGWEYSENDNTCECPEGERIIDGQCQTEAAFCEYEKHYARQEVRISENGRYDPEAQMSDSTDTVNPTREEARYALCNICPRDAEEDFNGDCQVPTVCRNRGEILDRANANNVCVCEASGHEVSDGRASYHGDSFSRNTCSPALPSYPVVADGNSYTQSTCADDGRWTAELRAVTIQADAGFHLVETCNIRVRFVEGISLNMETGDVLARNPSNDFEDFCILRHNDGADLTQLPGGGALMCSDDRLFGDAGLPARPDGFGSGDYLLVVSTMTADNQNMRIAFRDQILTDEGFVSATEMPTDTTDPTDPGTGGGEVPTTPSTPTGGGGGGAGPAAGAGILLIGLAYVAFADGDPSSFHITPQAKFEIRNDIPRYSYGTRMEINKDEWTLWWTADESRVGDADGAFGFGYGGAWTRDSLQASASVHTDMEEDVSELRAGLRTEWTLSNWTVRPAYRFRAEVEQGEWTFENGLDLAAQLSQAGWIIRPSVNADLWAAAEPDARLRLQVGREF